MGLVGSLESSRSSRTPGREAAVFAEGDVDDVDEPRLANARRLFGNQPTNAGYVHREREEEPLRIDAWAFQSQDRQAVDAVQLARSSLARRRASSGPWLIR